MSYAQTHAVVDAATEFELHAYNAAFYELGLRWHWDADTYESLREIPSERDRLQTYLERHQSHLLKVYDAEFLSNAVEQKRTQYRQVRAMRSPEHRGRYTWAGARTEEVGH